MIKVSVILPAFNSDKFIADTITSVLNQTYRDYELIIIDDGSTDDTAKIVGRYVSTYSNIKYICQSNQGHSIAKNVGIKASKGEYIAFLDHDDLWLPEKLEKQVNVLNYSYYQMVFCDMQYLANGKVITDSYLKTTECKNIPSGNIYCEMLSRWFVFSSTVLINRDCFKKIGVFNNHYQMAEDYDMWLRVANNYKIKYLDEKLVVYRAHESNMSRDLILGLNSLILLFRTLLHKDSMNRKEKLIIRKRLGGFYFNLGYYYWDKENMLLARVNFLKSTLHQSKIKVMSYILASYLPRFLIMGIRKIKKHGHHYND